MKKTLWQKIVCIPMVLIMIATSLFAVGCKKWRSEVNADGMIELHTWFFTSGIPNNVIVFKHEDESVVFDCSVDEGYLIGSQSYVKTLSVKANDWIYWYRGGIVEQDFVKITVKKEEHIIGYAVIEILQENILNYTAEVLKSVLYPQKDGEYQDITQEKVDLAIEQIINKNKKG